MKTNKKSKFEMSELVESLWNNINQYATDYGLAYLSENCNEENKNCFKQSQEILENRLLEVTRLEKLIDKMAEYIEDRAIDCSVKTQEKRSYSVRIRQEKPFKKSEILSQFRELIKKHEQENEYS
ncbi:MAG: hypothetical protein K9M56_04330 [Victivallales bacterium]|nr:hypothetical protein [Victivallales bacterium]